MFDNWKNKMDEFINGEDDFTAMIRARDNGEEWAQAQLDELFRSNDPTLGDRIDRARIKIYKDAAYQGDVKAQYMYGMALRKTNKNESLRMLCALADRGDADAMAGIASGYTKYGGYGENEEEYMKWSIKAANAGDLFSQNMVGLQYTIRQDYDTAFYWYEKAANQGSATGYCGMADCYKIRLMRLRMAKNSALVPKINELENQIEYCYFHALDCVASAEEDAEACMGIAEFYLDHSNNIYDNVEKVFYLKRAVYFFYYAYDAGNPSGMEKIKRICGENNIYVDFNDMEGWKEREKLFEVDTSSYERLVLYKTLVITKQEAHNGCEKICYIDPSGRDRRR